MWTALTDLDKLLSSKKPRDRSIRDWRADMDKWRLSRRSLTSSDIAQDIEHLRIMRCLETCWQEPWYAEYRKTMARDEHRGIVVDSADELWRALESEEADSSGSSRYKRSVNYIDHDGDDDGGYSYKRSRRGFEDCSFGGGRSDRKGKSKGKGRNKGKGTGKGRDKGKGKGKGNVGRGFAFWRNIGLAPDYPNPRPNDPS